MKKTISFWLIVGLCLSFFGCAQSPSGGTVAVVEKFGSIWSLKDPSYPLKGLPKRAEGQNSREVYSNALKEKMGNPITLTKAGDKFETTIIYKLNTELYKNELNLFALAQDFETKTILQGVELPLQEQPK